MAWSPAPPHYVHPTGADWHFACTIEHNHPLKETELGRKIQPTEAAKIAMKALKVKGTVGWSELQLSGADREKALKAFRSSNLPGKKRNVAKADAKPFINKGRKFTKQKKYDEAIKAFTTAIRKDPKAARAWSGRGYALLKAGKLKRAQKDFDHALTLDATDKYHAAIWFNLGQIAEQRGKLRMAKRAYQKAYTLRPSKAAENALNAVKKKLKK